MSNSSFPIIDLPNPLEIQKAVNTNHIEILQTVDDPIAKTVKSLVKTSSNPYSHNWYTVWSDDSYDQVGQWTDAQLASEIINLVTGSYPAAIIR